jgi:LacI family transcriptional regulator
VEEAVAKLGYRPNAFASALRRGSSRSIGLLIPSQRSGHLAELAEAIEQVFTARGYLVITGSTQHDRMREERLFQSLVDRRVDAIVLAPGVSLATSPAPGARDQLILALEAIGAGHRDVSSIQVDERSDAAFAVQHLQGHGHQVIGCVANSRHTPADGLRIAGWRDALEAVGARAGGELLAMGDTSAEGGYVSTQALLSPHGRPWAVRGESPSALLVTSDVQALGSLSACHELGLSVPDDIAIVSMGGTASASYTIPPLTTLRQDVRWIATRSADVLIDQIENEGKPRSITGVRGNLVIGSSCGCDAG